MATVGQHSKRKVCYYYDGKYNCLNLGLEGFTVDHIYIVVLHLKYSYKSQFQIRNLNRPFYHKNLPGAENIKTLILIEFN